MMDGKKLLQLSPETIVNIVTNEDISDDEAFNILMALLDEVRTTMFRDKSSCHEQVKKLNAVCRGLRRYTLDKNMMKFMYYGMYEIGLQPIIMTSEQKRRMENDHK